MGVRVFISYAHIDAAHIEAVRRFWQLLLSQGVDARLDVDATSTRQDWPVWIMQQFREADFVIVVASSTYRKRAEGEATPGEGLGAQFEGALLRGLIYEDRQKWFPRVLPVILPGQSVDGVPIFLGPRTGSVYPVAEFSAAGIRDLLAVLGVPSGGSLPVVARPVPDNGGRSSLAEMDHLVTLLEAIRELADATARDQVLSLLDPDVRPYIETGRTTRLQLIAVVRGCARFGEPGRAALLDVLRYALPQNDPAVRDAAAAVAASWLFDR